MNNDHSPRRPLSRRAFVGAALAATGALTVRRNQGAPLAMPAEAEGAGATASPATVPGLPKKPTDQVVLGKSGIRTSVVGMGTGSIGYGHQSNQTRLGDKEFTHLMRHGFDSGITLFDLADSYGSHQFMARAMAGLPREHYVLQTKTESRDAPTAREDIDRFLRELKTDYIDSVLIPACGYIPRSLLRISESA